MSQGEKIIQSLRGYIMRVRKKYPEVTNDQLKDSGQTIYYMNKERKTEFVWRYDDKSCDFCILYKDKEPFLAVSVDRYGRTKTITPDYSSNNNYPYEEQLFSEEEALYLAALMNHVADCRDLYNRAINQMDFSDKLTPGTIEFLREHQSDYI